MKRFQNVTIIGVGLLGGSLGLALKRKGFKGQITGVSRPETIARACEIGAIDTGLDYGRLSEATTQADLIYLCTPIARIEELLCRLGALGDKLKKDCVITDVGSTKLHLCNRAAAVLPEHLPFIGGHPMTGSEKSGVDAADPFLFENSFYVLTPGANVPADVGQAFSGFTRRLGARVLVMDPGVHDKVAAVISHTPQLLAVALVNWAARHQAEHKETLQLAAGGFRDMTRIASSSFEMWKDIFATNQDQIERRLDEFIGELKSLKIDLVTGKLSERFSSARAVRHTIPRDTKGFLHPLYEILVLADDRPGVIAEIAVALAKEGINISDIEVMKVREGEGGTLRLGFESIAAAERAIHVLGAIRYAARLRE